MEKYIFELPKEDKMFGWYQTASTDEHRLCDKVYEFEELFSDMRFQPGSITGDFVSVQSKAENGNWEDDVIDLPEELEYLSPGCFTYLVKDLGGFDGEFNKAEYTLTVSPRALEDDSVILHEMIHMYEFAVNSLPLYWHDAIIMCLYKDLKKKINDLDDRIASQGHIFTSHRLAVYGGTHDILFHLKSLDLDLRMGYPLGTVFGYGMAAEEKD